MASVATREGLVQAMRDMVAAPDRGWLGTALEVSRRVRTDPDFRATWERRAAEITRATRDRLTRQREAGVLRDDVDIDVLVTYLELVREGLVAHLAADLPSEHLTGVLDLVESSVRRHP
jgi:hypothetical protein